MNWRATGVLGIDLGGTRITAGIAALGVNMLDPETIVRGASALPPVAIATG
jgi:hypothetical protein